MKIYKVLSNTCKNPKLVGYYLKRIVKKFKGEKGYQISEFENSGIIKKEYKNYEDYVKHQKSKLSNLLDFDNFFDFGRMEKYDREYRETLKQRIKENEELKQGMSCLCLGARLGTEVKSFIDLGIFAVGVDLNPGKNNKYVVVGDFHNLQYSDNSVDIIFSNSIDHSLYLDDFLLEAQRVLKPDGYFLIEIGAETDDPERLKHNYEAIAYKDIDLIVDKIKEINFSILRKVDISFPWKGVQILFKVK